MGSEMCIRDRLLDMVKQMLPEGYDMEKHFTPSYNPWDQRLCLVPNADLFESIKSGKAEVVTAEIDQITENGICLKNGDELPADIIVLATGLKLEVLAGVPFTVDGEVIDFSERFTYKGMMYSGVDSLLLKGRVPWTFHHPSEDYAATRPARCACSLSRASSPSLTTPR